MIKHGDEIEPNAVKPINVEPRKRRKLSGIGRMVGHPGKTVVGGDYVDSSLSLSKVRKKPRHQPRGVRSTTPPTRKTL